MDEIYEAMRETVAIKDGDRFMAITEHGQDAFAYGPFLGIDRSDDLVQIQVFWAPGKSTEAKLAMYRRIVERLGENPGVRPEDVLISVSRRRPRTGPSATARRSSTSPPIPSPRAPDGGRSHARRRRDIPPRAATSADHREPARGAARHLV